MSEINENNKLFEDTTEERYDYILHKGLLELCDNAYILGNNICFYDKIKDRKKPFLILYLKTRSVLMISRLLKKTKMARTFKKILIKKGILIHNSEKRVQSSRDGGYERPASFENTCNIITINDRNKYVSNKEKIERKRVYDLRYQILFSKYLYLKSDSFNNITIHPRYVIKEHDGDIPFDSNQDYSDTDKERHDKATEHVEYIYLSKYPTWNTIKNNKNVRYFYKPIFAQSPIEKQMDLF